SIQSAKDDSARDYGNCSIQSSPLPCRDTPATMPGRNPDQTVEVRVDFVRMTANLPRGFGWQAAALHSNAQHKHYFEESTHMARPVTLFAGQWADLALSDMARKASEFGYQGIELACWGDHFEVDKALDDKNYCSAKRDALEKHDLQCFAISNHLVGQ